MIRRPAGVVLALIATVGAAVGAEPGWRLSATAVAADHEGRMVGSGSEPNRFAG
jgi:hypothetical protein